MVARAKGPDGINPRSVFHQGLIRVLFLHEVQKGAGSVPRPRGENREIGSPSNKKEVKQVISPASRTRSKKKLMEEVSSETPVTAEEEYQEADSTSTGNVSSNKTCGTPGHAQSFEEEEVSEKR